MLRTLGERLGRRSGETLHQSRLIRGLTLVVSLMIAIMAPVVEVVTVKSFVLATEIRYWPTTKGVVAKSELIKEFVGVVEYTADIEYVYRVNAREYRSNSIRVRGEKNQNYSDIAALVNRYPAGHEVTVYYSQDNAADSYLEAGPDFFNYAGLIVPLFFAFAFGYLFVALLRGWI